MIQKNTKKELIYSQKNLINKELFNYLDTSNINEMEIKEATIFYKILLRDIEILSIIFNKAEKDLELSNFINSKYLTSKNKEERELRKDILFYKDLTSDSTLKSLSILDLRNFSYKDKEDLIKLFELMLFLNSLIEPCKKRIRTLFFNSPQFTNIALNHLIKEYNIKKSVKKTGIKGEMLNNAYGSKTFSFSLPKSTIDNAMIIATFSEFTKFINKSKQQSIHAQLNFGSHLGLDRDEDFINKIQTDWNNNSRQLLSGIASTLFVEKIQGENYLKNLIMNEKSSINNKNYIDLLEFKTQNIVYIYNKEFNSDYEKWPNFINLFDSKSKVTFNLTTISLDLFCLAFSTLLRENRFVKKTELNKQEVVLVDEDTKINSSSLYLKIFKFLDLKKSIFIFNNCSWSTVLKKLHQYELEVSGGSVVKRHIPSPTDFKLLQFFSKFSKNPYKDIVNSTHFLDKSVYQSKFTKSELLEYNSDLLSNYIDSIVNSIASYIVKGLNKKIGTAKIYEEKEFISNLKSFVVNDLIFIQCSAVRAKLIFNDDLSSYYRERLYNFALYSLTNSSTQDIKSSLTPHKSNYKDYLKNKINNQKRNYSTRINPILSKDNSIDKQTKIRIIKTKLTEKHVRSKIGFLIRNSHFDFNFIKVEIKLALSASIDSLTGINNSKPTFSLAEPCILNLENKFEKKKIFFVQYLLDNYNNLNINENLKFEIEKKYLIILFSKQNKKSYDLFINKHLKLQEFENKLNLKENLSTTWSFDQTMLRTPLNSKKVKIFISNYIKFNKTLYQYLVIQTKAYINK